MAERDKLDEARAVLAVLEPASPEFMDWTAAMAEAYQSLGFEPEARRLDEALFEVVERVQSHPVLSHKRRWPNLTISTIKNIEYASLPTTRT